MSVRLSDLESPPSRPDFHDELRRRIESVERANARRRRVAAVIAVAAAAIVVSAASVSAFRGQTRLTTLDQTQTCAVPQTGGVNRVDLIARVRGPGSNYGGVVLPNYAEAVFAAADVNLNSTELAVAREIRRGYGFAAQLCHSAARIPLARAGLPSIGVVSGTRGATIQKECWLAPTVTIRMHIVFAASAKPVAAQLALRSGRKLRPAAYIDWTPTRAAAFASGACSQG